MSDTQAVSHTGEAQVEPGHYDGLRYDERARWSSYWHQIDETLAVSPASVLEIGVGSRVVGRYLAGRSVPVVGVDIDPRLDPERVGDVRALPCTDEEFDVVLCCQVLEHLPLAQVPTALAELRRVCRRRVVLSLPVCGRSLRLLVRIPPLRPVSFVATLPSRHGWQFDGQHHWQFGARNAPRRTVRALIREQFAIAREYQTVEDPYRRFFILEPHADRGGAR